MDDRHIEHIGNGISVVTSAEHGFGTDAILLAHFASPRKKDKTCDFGTGCGIIPMIWCRNQLADHIYAVEIQPKAYLQALSSVEISAMQNKVDIFNCDLKSIKGIIPDNSMDVVSMNPPYKADGCGIKSVTESDKIARHETECTLDDISKSAAYILKFGGRLCLCGRPERLCETTSAMQKSGIEPKKLRFVVKKAGSRPWLFLIEGRKGGKPYLNVDASLIMYNEDGSISDEVKEIYGDYEEQYCG